MKKLYSIAILSAAILSLAGLKQVQAKHDPMEDYPKCSSKTTVAVDRFKTENISFGWWNNDVALNSREVAVDELVNSGCFSVLERENYSIAPAGVMNEKSLARSDEARPGAKSAKKRQMKTADYLVSYALVGGQKDGEGLQTGGLGGSGGGFGGLGGGFKKSELNLTCKVFSTSTSEILASSKVKATDTGFNVNAAGGGVGAPGFGVGGLGYFKDSKVGKMMSKVIHDCTVNMAKAMAR